MAITFVKPRYYYQSYSDFWSLVEMSGFEWCYMDQMNLKSNCTYIVTLVDPKRDKFHLSWWQRKTKSARLILWNIERPAPRGGVPEEKRFLSQLHFDEIWSSDLQLSRDLGTRFVILGSDARLGNKPFLIKRYNFAPMCYINDRRKPIINKLSKVAPNAWGKKRDTILRSSRYGLSIHQDNDLYTEPLRLALFAAYSLPVISESIYETFPYPIVTASIPDIINFNYREIKGLGRELKNTLCIDYKFKNMVEYAVRS